MKKPDKKWILAILAMVFCLRIPNCGGGSEGNSPSLAEGIVMSWEAPTKYVDRTSLDPLEELDVYEIYVSDTGGFSDEDYPEAYVSAVDSHGNATESFDLGNLNYHFVPGETYYISMRSVTKNGVRSDFSGIFMFIIRTGSDFYSDSMA